jgi:pterin-4a-carbinolamine dehydratase
MQRIINGRGKRLFSNSSFLKLKSLKVYTNISTTSSLPFSITNYRRQYQQFSSLSTKDPTAKRPNKICDPYEQNGKPLSYADASQKLSILDAGWKLSCYVEGDKDKRETNIIAGAAPDEREPVSSSSSSSTAMHSSACRRPPLALEKEYYHQTYIDASRFASIVASVAHNNNHYPKIIMERRLMKKEKAWRVVTTVQCYTEVLGGLSFHDFHIAMMIDVEVSREHVQKLCRVART